MQRVAIVGLGLIGGSIGNVHRNAPFVIMQILLVLSVFGILTTTAFVANAIHRDFELGTDALFFSTPVPKWQFISGRFLGSFSVAVLLYITVGMLYSVESSLNHIFAAESARNIARKISDYAAILFITPICLAIAREVP